MGRRHFLNMAVMMGTFAGCLWCLPVDVYTPDEKTVVLLHLDGNSRDSSGCENNGTEKGVTWSEGKFGQAGYFNGKAGIVFESTGSLCVGKNSWTVEAWIKPEKQQPTHATIISGGWSNERIYWLRISEGKYLVAGFGDGVKMVVVSSGDLSDILFDGQWHHVATVLDRSREGEVRLYLDGRRIDSGKSAFCGPIVYETQTMGLVIGAIAPWYIGREGYQGWIDEIRISNTVRPEYLSKEPPPEQIPAVRKEPFRYDIASSRIPLSLEPANTVIVLHSGVIEDWTRKAATLLQTWLRGASRENSGFEIVAEEKISERDSKVIIALGKTRWVEEEEVKDLWRDGFLIKRKGNVIILCGGQSRGTLFAAVRFLDRVAGVRFYLPTDLFTSLPENPKLTLGNLEILENPFVHWAVLSPAIFNVRGTGDWPTLVAGYRRIMMGSHQHNMFLVFPPERYAEKYPEIYPVISGKRYIPRNNNDQNWQPCFSSPQTLEAARETVSRHFRKHPQEDYLTFSINDSHSICECPACTAFYETFKGKDDDKTYREKAHSFLYWQFMNKLGEWMEKEFPGKYIIGLAYGITRFPPPFTLRPNIIPVTNFHIAELEADGILKPEEDGLTPLDKWLNIASNYGNHDWYHGNGFVLPRIYSTYWSQFLQYIQKRSQEKKIKRIFMYAETGPNWGLDGPKYYILARLWQDPAVDVKILLKQFCADMFGPAAQPMEEYFTRLENLWITLDNKKGPERKLFQWSRQLLTDEQDREEIKKCRKLLDYATSLTVTEEQKKRINLFSRTFRLTEYLVELNAATTVSRSRLEEIKKFVAENISGDPMTLYDNTAETMEKIIKALTGGKKIVD